MLDEVRANVEATVTLVWLLVEQQKQRPQVKEEVDNKLELPGIVETRSLGCTPSRGRHSMG